MSVESTRAGALLRETLSLFRSVMPPWKIFSNKFCPYTNMTHYLQSNIVRQTDKTRWFYVALSMPGHEHSSKYSK